MMGRFTWVLLCVLVALATHIAYVLFLPSREFERQLSRNIADLAPNTIRVISPEAQRTMLPSYRGESAVAICVIDLREGAVKISAQVPQTYWTATIHTLSGTQVYSINDAQAESESIDVQVNLARGMISQVLEGGEGEDATDVANAGYSVELPEPRGIAVVWVPLADPLVRPDVEATLGKSKCGTVKS
jgi:uncharacterized membrane protein